MFKSPPARARDPPGALAPAESSMPPPSLLFPVLTLNTSAPTRMDWEERRAMLFTIKSCIFVSSSL